MALDGEQVYYTKSKEEINSIFNYGVFNPIVDGYLIMTLAELGYSEEEIKKASYHLEKLFDRIDAQQARDIRKQLWD